MSIHRDLALTRKTGRRCLICWVVVPVGRLICYDHTGSEGIKDPELSSNQRRIGWLHELLQNPPPGTSRGDRQRWATELARRQHREQTEGEGAS